eukprot:tig00000498_g1605.t1
MESIASVMMPGSKGKAKHSGEGEGASGTMATSASSRPHPMIEQINAVTYRIKKGYVPGMNVEGRFFVNQPLAEVVFEELEHASAGKGGGFLPAPRQIANVASLPGIVGASIGMPDIHSGYGFAIGNVAAMDMEDPQAVVSPGGVGFDINCGVRLIRTNLTEDEVAPHRERLTDLLYKSVPVGVGSQGSLTLNTRELDDVLARGMEWSLEKGHAWPEDLTHCEEGGRLRNADPGKVSGRAKKRGLSQIGTLGAGNHYEEIQVVDEIFDEAAARAMGITAVGQVVVMLHCGSRGLGHQVATDALQDMDRVMARDKIKLNDRQLACARIHSKEGQDYIAAMYAAANFAWVNRSFMTHLTRRVFADFFKKDARELGMHLVYDVCHNIAKEEEHVVDGRPRRLLVHRKGATRAFGPGHPLVPAAYREVGQPVLIGGSMGTCSYVLVGTEGAMRETFGSTCHGAGRVQSRHAARSFGHAEVLADLERKGISIRVATPKLVGEEAPGAYKDVTAVVDTCHEAGISKKVLRLRPIGVIKG